MKLIIGLFVSSSLLASSAADWEYTYQSTPIEQLGWYNIEIDSDIKKLIGEMRSVGTQLLDLGSGPGIQTIALARAGFEVTGVDISETAVREAQRRAGSLATFVQADVCKHSLGGPYDIVIDRACLHCLSSSQWPAYLRNVSQAVRPGGLFILKCYSWTGEQEPPHRFTEREIRQLFGGQFEILRIKPTFYQSNYRPYPSTYLAVMRKI